MAGVQWLGWMPQKPSPLEGIGQLAQGLNQYIQQQRFQNDINALSNMQTLQGFQPQSMQMQQMMGQNFMNALAPMGPIDRVRLAAEKARLAHWQNRGQSPNVYSPPQLDKTGEKTGTKGAMYQEAPNGRISILHTPEEPETLQERLKYWQNVRRIAKGTDTGSTMNRLLAESLGQKYEVTEDTDLVKLADEKIQSIIGELSGKNKSPQKNAKQNMQGKPAFHSDGRRIGTYKRDGTIKLNVEGAKIFLEIAGGDKQKAMRMAREQGYDW